MVDYMIWPWFERLDALSILYGSEAKIPPEKYPKLVRICVVGGGLYVFLVLNSE